MTNTKKAVPVKKSGKGALIGVGAAIVLLTMFFIIKSLGGSSADTAALGGDSISGDITITKSDVTATAKFIPYKAGNIKMEVIALKAPDGSVRTAFNTCQVCYDSGRGYYEQEGDELVCQNCGNRFKASQVELIKGGCNPVPIDSGNKTDDGTTITISNAFMEENKGLFGNWKK